MAICGKYNFHFFFNLVSPKDLQDALEHALEYFLHKLDLVTSLGSIITV